MNYRLGLCAALVLMAFCGTLAAAEPAPAVAPPPPTVEQRLEAAMADYAERSIETLAASDSPRERWIAGLMLLDGAMRNADAAERADAMQQRGKALLDGALSAGQDDPTLLFWAILDPPMRDQSDGDALAEARLAMAARLQKLEPDNAVVWIGTLPPRDTAGTIPVAIEMLAKAAAAKRFDTHFAASMRMLLAAFAKVPLPDDWPDTHALPGWDGVEKQDLQVILAVGMASALAMPYLAATQWWCGGDSDAQPWIEDCRKLAALMVEHSDSIVPRSLGLALIAKRFAADSAEAKSAIVKRRELAWLIENGLQRVGPGQPVPFATWRQAWAKADADELSVARAIVDAQKLPLLPPDDFVPAWDRAE